MKLTFQTHRTKVIWETVLKGPTYSDSSIRRPGSEAAYHAGAHLHQLERQASNLEHILGSLLEAFLRIKTGGHYFFALILPCARAPVSPIRELVPGLVPQFLQLPTRGCLLITCLWRPEELTFPATWFIITSAFQKGHIPSCHPNFYNCSQETPLYPLAFVASGAYIHRCH